jgi:uncharacterized phage-associated protein
MKDINDESLSLLKKTYEALSIGPFSTEVYNEILTKGTNAIENIYKNKNETAANLVRLDPITKGDVLYRQTETFDAFQLEACKFRK